jgi:flagellar hook-length control protein FliK
MAGLKTVAQSNVVVDAKAASTARQSVGANGPATSAFGELLNSFENAPPDSRSSSSIGTGAADDSTNPDENLAPPTDENGAASLDAMLEEIVSGRSSNKAAIGAGFAPESGVGDQPDRSNPDRIRTLFANAIAAASGSLRAAPSTTRTSTVPASTVPASRAGETAQTLARSVRAHAAGAAVAKGPQPTEGIGDPIFASETPGIGDLSKAHRRRDESKTSDSGESDSGSREGPGASVTTNPATIATTRLDSTPMAYMAAIQNQPNGSFGALPTTPSVGSSTRAASTAGLAGPAGLPQSNVFQDFSSAPDDAVIGPPDYSVDAVRTFLAVGSPAERFVAPDSAGAPAISIASASARNASTSTRTEKISREARGRGAVDAASPSASSDATTPLHDDLPQAATADGEREKHARASDPAKQDPSTGPASNDTTRPNVPSTPDPTGAGSPSAGVAYSVAASDLPRVIASLADDRSPAGGSIAPTGRSTVTAPSTTPGDTVVKELELSLDPADLGRINVKLRSDGGNLSVVIEVQKREALKQVEAQKDQIAQRLGADGQIVSSVVVREAPAATHSSDGNDAGGSTGGAYNSGSNGNAEGSRGGGNNGSNRNLEHYDRGEDAQRPDPPVLDGNVAVRRTDGGIFF